MSKETEWLGVLVVGFFIGVLSIIALTKLTDSNVSRYNKAIEECQKSLPRDQFCKVIAIPVPKDEK